MASSAIGAVVFMASCGEPKEISEEPLAMDPSVSRDARLEVGSDQQTSASLVLDPAQLMAETRANVGTNTNAEASPESEPADDSRGPRTEEGPARGSEARETTDRRTEGRRIDEGFIPMETVALDVDSGPLVNTGAEPAVIYRTTVTVPRAASMQLFFGAETELSGSSRDGNESVIVVTSKKDGAVGRTGRRELRTWRNRSYAFNGDTVEVELHAHPVSSSNSGASRVVIEGARVQFHP